ncbi:mycothiol synthase [Microbacterium sp. MPKO10]|uniref:mycothiol synthase n=1 Tax=Microbacterium sp. MPKO10 TaxID=2989818 RepID=UPI0022356A00|nr:mycothiol synthase [Microbacterium sp. MPKO10]MCW4458538.1 mycothiol synthase [Microbacterium sp. MPKO10]
MLRETDLTEHDERLGDIIAAARETDGQPPFSDQSIVEARAGGRHVFDVVAADGAVTGAAIARDADPAEFELVIAPQHRGRGHGRVALSELLSRYDGEVLTWAHGDHPAAARLAASARLSRIRTLYQLRMPLDGVSRDVATFDRFDADRDADGWVALNARVFADHPEQGRISRADLDARMSEPWFRAEDMLVARSDAGELIGYNWLKVTGDIGEIYVLGVDGSAAGRGLGRALTEAGLAHLAERGCRQAALYVDDDNPRAVHLYRSLGFADHTVDVQYRRDASV